MITSLIKIIRKTPGKPRESPRQRVHAGDRWRRRRGVEALPLESNDGIIAELEADGKYKLKFNAGTLLIEINSDALAVFSFTRELIKDKSGLEADYTTFQHFKVEQSEVDSLICSCLLLVEDDELD